MNCKITVTPDFRIELKHLAKKYASIKEDYASFLNDLRTNPLMGKELGKHLRKVRFPIASKGKGKSGEAKSGGARVITHKVLIEINDANITLLTIYDKSEKDNVSDKELRRLMRKNGLN